MLFHFKQPKTNIMRTNIIMLAVLLATITQAQDATGEALEARKTKNFIFVRKGINNKGEPAVLISADSRSVDRDNYVSQINTAVPKRSQTLSIRVAFQNPLEYKISSTITSIDDPNFEAISKFAKEIETFSALLNKQNKTTPDANATVPGPNKQNASLVTATSSTKEKMEKAIFAPVLAGWKYLVLSNNAYTCLNDYEMLTNNIYAVDEDFFSGKNTFNIDFIRVFNALRKCSQAKDYLEKYQQFLDRLNELSQKAGDSKKNIEALGNYAKQSLKAADSTKAKDGTKTKCDYFADYTRGEIEKFLVETNKILTDRESLLASANALAMVLADFNKRLDPPEQNSFILNRISIDPKKIQEVKLVFARQKIEVVDNKEIKVSEVKDEVLNATVKVRAYRTFLPELSTGIFYTNLTYPKYGVTEESGKFKVSDAGSDKYGFIAATHLNLITNLFDGEVHPMLQIGVGTAKELPSLLGGVGLRFTGPIKIAISFGAITTWRKELDKLKIGDLIDGTTKLEEDLKYTLQKKPGFYVGIQYNF
jgi:hypothetical protein